jgi:hypothetical protein
MGSVFCGVWSRPSLTPSSPTLPFSNCTCVSPPLLLLPLLASFTSLLQFAHYTNYANTMETNHLAAWEIPEDALDVRVNPLPADPLQLAFSSCELRCKVSRHPAFFVQNIMLIVCMIVSMSFLTFSLDIDDLGNRLQVRGHVTLHSSVLPRVVGTRGSPRAPPLLLRASTAPSSTSAPALHTHLFPCPRWHAPLILRACNTPDLVAVMTSWCAFLTPPSPRSPFLLSLPLRRSTRRWC